MTLLPRVDKRQEMRIAGEGGQGIILASIILAEAALEEGYHVVQTQSYGPESRGGTSRADVIIAPAEIDNTTVVKPDLLLAMNKASFRKYAPQVRPGGIILADQTFVGQEEIEDFKRSNPDMEIYSLPFTSLAQEKLGTTMVANIVALATLVGLTRIVSPENLRVALNKHVPKEVIKINLTALEAGLRLPLNSGTSILI
ncbi:MAG: 2-oxoglutarate ferredoxin oxidoreductase subunit gamma [Clostridia bacterium]|nr:2-oxoglutarate ferredoxin oxidoreductase subunit gamma [Clostridia bacterium]